VKSSIQALSRTLLSVVAVVALQAPIGVAHAAVILPQASNGSTVWTGSDPLELDAAQIGAIVGVSALSSLYEAGFGNATLATGGENPNQIVNFIAKQSGLAGHDISVEIVSSGGANQPLSVSVIGGVIKITLATNATGAVTSTAAQVAAAVNADPSSSALVQASAGGTGTGTVLAQTATGLTPVVVEAGPFAASYATAFANSPSSPQDATVSYGAGASIAMSSLFLYVRDTSAQPAFYIYDLLVSGLSWNGLDSLQLQGFWPNAGAIEELKIVGGSTRPTPTPVPEGSSLALLALGLGVLALRRRPMRSAL